MFGCVFSQLKPSSSTFLAVKRVEAEECRAPWALSFTKTGSRAPTIASTALWNALPVPICHFNIPKLLQSHLIDPASPP